jgi:ribose 5-phosphate isomerase RpiB
VIGPELAASLVQAFLKARYLGRDPGGERLARRVGEIKRIEQDGKL